MRLSRITLYPIKSLDGIDVDSTEVTILGSLWGDRMLALVDSKDRWVHGKNTPQIHDIAATYSPDLESVTLSSRRGLSRQTMALTDLEQLSSWFSLFLQQPIRVLHDEDQGFPDDLDANGPTLVSESSLVEVAGWFQWSVEDTHRRFRSNLVIQGAPAFFEDQLFGPPGFPVHFQIGDLRFEGINPCQRCVVPSRSPDTGEPSPGFQKSFSERRNESLPHWAELSQFNHFYRFAVNTRITPGQAGRQLKVGQVLTV